MKKIVTLHEFKVKKLVLQTEKSKIQEYREIANILNLPLALLKNYILDNVQL